MKFVRQSFLLKSGFLLKSSTIELADYYVFDAFILIHLFMHFVENFKK